MVIEKIGKKDIDEISALIKKEFPYVWANPKSLENRLKHSEIFVFVSREKNELTGFVDFSLVQAIGRINGFSVKEKFRKKGYGQKLLQFAVEFMKENGAEKIHLLVKTENAVAKKMYKTAGFHFTKMHPKKIDGSMVEEMEIEFKNGKEKNIEKMVS